MVEAGSSTPARSTGEADSTGLDHRRFAGRVLFPRTPAELTTPTQCPACFTVLTGTVCPVCQLDLSHPAAGELAALSRDAADLLDRRLEVIGRIRYDTAQALAGATAAEAAAPAAGLPAESPADAVVTPPRRSSVQVILLIVGISLLSVAAIFFLVYAFINFGILGRSLIIAAVTIASFAIASGLRRRSLTATAEGIAVLAVVLVYLDAFAVRANDFFGLGDVDVSAFWGATLVASVGGFLAWHRLAGLRTPHIVGFGAIVPGVGLLVGGINQTADDGSRLFVALAAAALAGVAHRFTSRPATATRPPLDGRIERLMVRGLTGVALVGAFVGAAAVAPTQPWASTAAFLVVAALAALHAWLVGTAVKASTTPSAAIFAGIGGVAAAVSVASGAVRVGTLDVMVIAPPLAAAFVALGLELLWATPVGRRRSDAMTAVAASHRRSALVAAIAAGAVAAIALLLPLAVAAAFTASTVSRAVSSVWTLAPGDDLAYPGAADGLAVLALALCCAMVAVAWTVRGALRRRAAIPAWAGVFVVVMAVPLLAALAAVFAGWLAIAAAALGALLWPRVRNLAPRLRAPVMVLLAVSGVLGYLVGWGSATTWWIGSIITVALLLASRLLPASPLGRATALGAAALVALIGAAAARHIARASLPDPISNVDNALRAVSIGAIVLLALSSFRVEQFLSSLDRRVVFWISSAAAAAAVGILTVSVESLSFSQRMSLLLPEPGSSLVVNAALFAALMLMVMTTGAARLPRERLVASVALAPVLSLVVDAFARVIGLPELVRSVGAICAALLVAVGVLVAATLRARKPIDPVGESRPGPLGGDRWPRELGILLVAVPSLVIGVARHDSVTWIVLVLAALVVLILATSVDGLVGSRSPRRHLGWAAIALATAGLWLRLRDSGITDLEPYVLPLSGALLLVALSVWRASRSGSTPVPAPDLVVPVITLVALLVAILPLGATAASGPLVRALVVGVFSAALVILGSAIIGTSGSRPFLDATALAGALGVLTVVIGRGISLIADAGTPNIRLDAWLGAGLLVLLISAFAQARERHDHSTAWRSIASRALGVVGLAILLGFELAAFEDTVLGSLRAIAVVLLFSALHVVGFLVDRAPFTRAIGWVAIAGAGVAAIGALVTGALVTGALRPVELGTIPIAAALVLTGALTLSSVPTARTWPWLAPGVSVLLIPSLTATADHPPFWRLVGLGVVGVAIIVSCSVLRLQAPFLIAVVVVLIHAVVTFAPQVRAIYESVEWWLWFVPVGLAVVVFAARFENSVFRLRSVAMRIRALR